jgi:hypothetical protein
MIKKQIVVAFLAVIAIAIGINVYAVVTDGWYAARSTMSWTLLIFGLPSIIWIIGDAIVKNKKL